VTPPLPSWQARRRELLGRLKDAVVRVPGARGERQAAAGGGRVLISAATAALLGLPHLPTPEGAAAPASPVPGTESPVAATGGPPVELDITAGGSEGGRPTARYTSRGGSAIAHSADAGQTLVLTLSPLRVDARASAYPGVAPSSSLKAAEALEASASPASPGHVQRPRLQKVAGGADSLDSPASGRRGSLRRAMVMPVHPLPCPRTTAPRNARISSQVAGGCCCRLGRSCRRRCRRRWGPSSMPAVLMAVLQAVLTSVAPSPLGAWLSGERALMLSSAIRFGCLRWAPPTRQRQPPP